MIKTDLLKIQISESIGSVSARLILHDDAKALMVLAHGAGAGMDHRFMEQLAISLSEAGVGTLRFNFPFTEHKKGRPDVPAVAEKTISTVLDHAINNYPNMPIIAAGKNDITIVVQGQYAETKWDCVLWISVTCPRKGGYQAS